MVLSEKGVEGRGEGCKEENVSSSGQWVIKKKTLSSSPPLKLWLRVDLKEHMALKGAQLEVAFTLPVMSEQLTLPPACSWSQCCAFSRLSYFWDTFLWIHFGFPTCSLRGCPKKRGERKKTKCVQDIQTLE